MLRLGFRVAMLGDGTVGRRDAHSLHGSGVSVAQGRQ